MAKKQSEVQADIEYVKKRMKPIGEMDSRFTACIYARNKVGKTRYACSSELDTFLIDCNEKGFDSVRKRTNVTYYPVNTFPDLDPAYWYLRSSNHNHKVVAIDTVTMLATIGMKYILKDDHDNDIDRDPMTPDKRSWGKLGEMMKDAIIKFRNLADYKKMHVIFLAQEKETTEEDDDGGTVTLVHPELSPAPRSTLTSAVGTIGRLYVKEVEKDEKTVVQRRMLLRAHPKYLAGTRFEELKGVEVNPTLQEMLTRIYGDNL